MLQARKKKNRKLHVQGVVNVQHHPMLQKKSTRTNIFKMMLVRVVLYKLQTSFARDIWATQSKNDPLGENFKKIFFPEIRSGACTLQLSGEKFVF